jgi:epoxyqueuosine reductase QueG
MSAGPSLVGFADLKGVTPSDKSALPFGISIAVAIESHIVSDITEGPTAAYVEECLRLDELLTNLGQKAVSIIGSHGYSAAQQATTNAVGAQYLPNFTTSLPHKTVATRAGLGWIGKCALLITPQFGSAVRLGSVLTDAPLSMEKPIETSRCGPCSACVDICPAHAIRGANWEAGIPRDSLVNVLSCRETAKNRLTARTGKEVAGRTFCGMCFAACPWTKSYVQNEKTA